MTAMVYYNNLVSAVFGVYFIPIHSNLNFLTFLNCIDPNCVFAADDLHLRRNSSIVQRKDNEF